VSKVRNDIWEQAHTVRAATQTAVRYLPDEIAAEQPRTLYDGWAAGATYAKGTLLTWNGRLYRVEQESVTSQEHQPPDAEGMLAVYRPIDDQHAGTAEDPIPWVYGMDCRADRYYSYAGASYLCKADMLPCVWPPDTQGLWQWEAA
jgi:hypothetical protein